MPGGATLAKDLGVGRMTVDAALDLLEQRGMLISQGSRLPRRISPKINYSATLKIAFLPYLIEDYRFDYIMDIQRSLQDDGHTVIFPDSSITMMKEDMDRIIDLVQKTKADAWILVAAPRELLAWFAESGIPAFALFGRRTGLPIAGTGPDKTPAMRVLIRHLISLGHQRISLLVRPMRRLPKPGGTERTMLEELQQAGFVTGKYNLPDWDGETDSLEDLIDSMFKLTPPTAMLIDEPPIFFSVQQRLARRGILAPEHVSLVCLDRDPYFNFQQPSIAHFFWDSDPWVRRVVKWVSNASQGKADIRQSRTKTQFVIGASIGPPPKGR